MKSIISPMLTTVADNVFDKSNFQGEIFFNWVRVFLERDSEWKAYLNDIFKDYLFNDCTTLAWTILDWEIIVKINGEFVKDWGSEEVNKLSSISEAPENVEFVYVVYDILSFLGRDLQNYPLHIRKTILEEAMISLDNVFAWKYNKKIILSLPIKHNKETFDAMVNMGYKWMIIKDLNSPYIQWEESKYWQKII
jgi:hypothetical protein